jgi:hypothetical protein
MILSAHDLFCFFNFPSPQDPHSFLIDALPWPDSDKFNPFRVLSSVYDPERTYPKTSQPGKFIDESLT